MKFIATSSGRVDKLLADSLPQYSRAALSKLFDSSAVSVDGRLVKAGFKVREGACIEADTSSLEQNQRVVELDIIYEDSDVVVVNKPAGIISHARGKYWYEPSVASFIRWMISGGSELKGEIVANDTFTPDYLITKSYPLRADNDGVERTGIVHRLDRATSGLMICAKNDNALKFLQRQFANRTVDKRYIAVLDGIPKDLEALIDAPIERNPKKPSTFRIGPNGKSAQTLYKVLRSGQKRSLVEFIPKTGRTHQLRLHAAYIGCPIVGDELYGTKQARLLLHAYKLTISIPSGGVMTFESKLPSEFDNAII